MGAWLKGKRQQFILATLQVSVKEMSANSLPPITRRKHNNAVKIRGEWYF